jgi:hypothetical protein
MSRSPLCGQSFERPAVEDQRLLDVGLMERRIHCLAERAATDQGPWSVHPYRGSLEHDANGLGAPDIEPRSGGYAQPYRSQLDSDELARPVGRVALGRQVSTDRSGVRFQYHSRCAPGQLPRAHTPF